MTSTSRCVAKKSITLPLRNNGIWRARWVVRNILRSTTSWRHIFSCLVNTGSWIGSGSVRIYHERHWKPNFCVKKQPNAPRVTGLCGQNRCERPSTFWQRVHITAGVAISGQRHGEIYRLMWICLHNVLGRRAGVGRTENEVWVMWLNAVQSHVISRAFIDHVLLIGCQWWHDELPG